ncbi:hypothetical protein [Kitasatospora sp. LaBMicrA B282]|uniref:hypothetical protein n=1 Tax=Kitasatospora sp. LaBMicrA B282 TaxID=3420949 RepID=UPI003D0D5869
MPPLVAGLAVATTLALPAHRTVHAAPAAPASSPSPAHLLTRAAAAAAHRPPGDGSQLPRGGDTYATAIMQVAVADHPGAQPQG